LICEITYFEDIGSYTIRFSFDNGTLFRPTNQKFTVVEDPIITDISPRVFLKHTEYQIRIYGRNFDPQFIKAVWVGNFRLSYQQLSQSEILVNSPVLSTVQDTAIDVRIESSMAGQFSNSQQIIFTNSLNISSHSSNIKYANSGI
jgi:hypothetical protein